MASAQDFDPSPRETLSAQEARMVMEAFSRQHPQAPTSLDGDSVQALASGLGVSEAEVRRILEDVRVQRRSEQMAAGILQEQHRHRKRLDVTAAIGAAVAFVVVAIAIIGFLFVRPRSTEQVMVTGPVNVPPVNVDVQVPDLPPIPVVLGNAEDGDVNLTTNDGTAIHIDDSNVSVSKPDGTSIVIDGNELTIARPNGSTVHFDNMNTKGSGDTAEIKRQAYDEVRKSMEEVIKKFDSGPNGDPLMAKATRKALEKAMSKLDKLSTVRQ